MQVSKRIENLPPYLFVGISKKIEEMKAVGKDVISFGIGDPDTPTPDHIIECLCQASRDPTNHRYPESIGLPELREAIAERYEKRFGLTFDPGEEVLPLIGAKEGIAHIALCFIDPGDIALIPDPGYPVYAIGTMFAGGESYYLPLTEENEFLPDMDKIPRQVAEKAKVLWMNYPHNPTSAVADIGFFERVVAFAKKYDIAVLHDGPYADIYYDDYRPVSFMEAPGARDVGIEFNSLSKSYNMTGWRIGMAVGNAKIINALMRVKSNLDSGIPQAIQYAAIEALRGPQDCISKHNAVYQKRRDKVVDILNSIGLEAKLPRASLYVWAKVPPGYNSTDFVSKLIEETSVVVTPGIGYGKYGEGYIRVSLTTQDEQLDKGLNRLRDWYDSHNQNWNNS
ncbi:MAG: LL-diaminopimelate aminotransferase [Dehalococcoidia bacterium]|nr:LL-diaminopimelate aminotransferase [Dehalococcoidia bacterium]